MRKPESHRLWIPSEGYWKSNSTHWSMKPALGHDHRPSLTGGGHGGHIEALLPLLVDPLEGERVAHFVAL